MIAIYNQFIYQPILVFLVFIYNDFAFNDLGVAIIILTVAIRFVFLPLFHKSAKSQMVMQKLQPEIENIKNRHKDNKEKQAAELMELYRRHGVNPFGNFLLLIIQLPILIALYQVFVNELSGSLFAAHSFLNLIDLQVRSNLLVGLATAAQYYQGRQLQLPQQSGGDSQAAKMNRFMVFLGPVITFAILLTLPAAVALYWLVTTVFSIGHQYYIIKSLACDLKLKAPKSQ